MGPWCAQMGVGGWVGMAAFWLVVVGLAIWAVTRLFPVRTGEDARATLDRRLARGDIDSDTYRAIRAQLDDAATTAHGAATTARGTR